MKLLQEIDPEGVVQRPNKRLSWRVYHSPGPNK